MPEPVKTFGTRNSREGGEQRHDVDGYGPLRACVDSACPEWTTVGSADRRIGWGATVALGDSEEPGRAKSHKGHS